jgi:hypothetical protein
MPSSDFAAALKSYRNRLAIAERLAKSDPDDARRQYDLAVTCAKLGYIYRRSNDPDDALAVLRRGQAIMVRLLKLSPDDASWKRDLAWFDDQIAALTN